MPTEEPILDDSRALAVRTELNVVTSAIEVALGVRELTPDFTYRRATLIAAGSNFTAPPKDDDEQDQVLAAQRALAGLRIEVTKQADALKSPLNSAREKIIELHKSGVATIKREEDRLAGLINNRQQKLLRERQEAEAAAERERKRIADEAAEAVRAQEEAERQRRAANLAAQQAELLKGKAKERAEQEAKRLAAAATQAEEEAFARSLAAESATQPVAPIVSEAPQAKEYLDFEISGRTDEEKKASLIKLSNAHPELFGAHVSQEKPRAFSLTLRILDLTERLNGKSSWPIITAAPGITITKKLSNLR